MTCQDKEGDAIMTLTRSLHIHEVIVTGNIHVGILAENEYSGRRSNNNNSMHPITNDCSQ